MLSFVATVPEEDLKKTEANVTVDDQSILFADPVNPDKPPVHYEFDQICADSQPLTAKSGGSKKQLIVTIFTQESPVTGADVAADLESALGQHLRAKSNDRLSIQCGFVFSEKARLQDVEVTDVKGLRPLVEEASFEQCVFVAKCPQFGYMMLPFYGNPNSSNMKFIEALRDEGKTRSEAFRVFTSCVFMYDSVVLNYKFSPHGDSKTNKSLLSLSMAFKNVVAKAKRSKKRVDATPEPVSTPTPMKKSSVASAMDSQATYPDSQYVGPDWSWRAFASVRDKRTKALKIDKQRLIYTAQKAADAPDVSGKVITEISQELDKQIGIAMKFEEAASKDIDKRQADFKAMKKEEARMAALRKELRLRYLKVKNDRKGDEKDRVHEVIGNEEDDIDTTIAILELEIDAVKRDIDYLKSAFGEDEEEETSESSEKKQLSASSEKEGKESDSDKLLSTSDEEQEHSYPEEEDSVDEDVE